MPKSKNRVVWGWAVIFALVGVALALLPLAGLLGYESSFLLALVGSLAAAHIGACRVAGWRRNLSSTERGLAHVWPLRFILGQWLACWRMLLLLLAEPVLILVANALRVRNCNLTAGLAWTLLLPAVSVGVALAVGLVAGLATRSARPAALAALAVVVGSLVWGLVRFYLTPAVFAYDPFAGYFPGSLYDEDVGIPNALYLARGLHLLWALAALVAASLFLNGNVLRLRWHAARDRAGTRGFWRQAIFALILVGASLAAWRSEPRLGLAPDQRSIAAALGGRDETPHFTLLYSPGGPWARDLKLTAEDVEFRYRQIARDLGLAPSRKITCYLFASSDEKRRFMGAARTQIAKPWRYEIYLQADEWPHPILKHELVHVFAGESGDWLFHVARRGFHFDVGLIEGVAVAVANAPAPLSLDQEVKVMRLEGVEPGLQQVFGLGFLALPSARAYTVAGSFVRFLLSEYGRERFHLLYSNGGDFRRAYGASLAELGARWSAWIDGRQLRETDWQAEAERFRQPSVLHKICAHELALRSEQADAEAARGDPQGAAALYRSICADEPGDPRHLVDLLGIEEQARDVGAVQEIARRILAHPQSQGAQRARALTALGDAKLIRGDASAAQDYRLALALPTREAAARQLRARLVAATDIRLGPALARYLIGDGHDQRDPALDLWRAHQVIDAAPDLGMGYYLAGRQLYQHNQFAEAASNLERALDLALPDEGFRAEARRLAGLARWRAGDRATARRHFESLAADNAAPREARNEASDFLER